MQPRLLRFAMLGRVMMPRHRELHNVGSSDGAFRHRELHFVQHSLHHLPEPFGVALRAPVRSRALRGYPNLVPIPDALPVNAVWTFAHRRKGRYNYLKDQKTQLDAKKSVEIIGTLQEKI